MNSKSRWGLDQQVREFTRPLRDWDTNDRGLF